MKKDGGDGGVLPELLAGILFLGTAAWVVLILFSRSKLYDSVGLWTGVMIACFFAVHMRRSIEESLDIGVDGAEKHARKAYLVRTVVALAVMGVVAGFGLGNPVTIVVGIFPLKLSAYLQPQTHRLFTWIKKRGFREGKPAERRT